jgi:hypothetical protein
VIIKIKNNSKKISLLQKITLFVDANLIDIKSIRILSDNEAILYYAESNEARIDYRSIFYEK